MSKREYRIIEIGGHKLDDPINMTMHTKRKKTKSKCCTCSGDIDVGETYFFYIGSLYCIGCIGAEGDPDFDMIPMPMDSTSNQLVECEECTGSGYVTSVCDGCEGNPDDYLGEESVCPECEGDGFIEKECPECSGSGKVAVPD